MKKLWGLVYLFVSVLVGGVLVAALPSEAQTTNPANPSLTIDIAWTHTVNSVSVTDHTNNNIPLTTTGSAVACTSAEVSLGYNYCYPITTGSSTTYGPCNTTIGKCRQFYLANTTGSSGGPAKLYVSDTSGTNLEKFTLSNTVLNPVPSTDWVNTTCATCGDQVVVTLTATNTFNLKPNDPTDGVTSFYPYGLSVQGQFTACVSSLTCAVIVNPVNDEMQMQASGVFITGNASQTIDFPGGAGSTSNTNCTGQFCPGTIMYLKVGGTSSSATTINLQQSAANPNPANQSGYPHYGCHNNWDTNPTTITDPITGASVTYSKQLCTPTITQAYVFKIFGPDSLSLWSSVDGAGENCGTKSAPPCDCTKFPKKCADNDITNYLGNQLSRSKKATAGIDPATPCDLNLICNGTINFTLIASGQPPQPSGCGLPPGQPCNQFNFNAIGPEVHAFTVTTDTSTGFGQADPFTHVFTGQGGHARVISNGIQPPKDATKGVLWQIDQWFVTNPSNTLVQGIDWDLLDAGNGQKIGVILYQVRTGETVTVSAHAHTCQTNCL